MRLRRILGLDGRLLGMLAVAGLLLVVLAQAPAAMAESFEASHWQIDSRAAPSYLQPGSEGLIQVTATNVGDVAAKPGATPITVKDALPAGLTVTSVSREIGGTPTAETVNKYDEGPCTSTSASVECSFTGSKTPIEPYFGIVLYIHVAVAADAASGLDNEVTVEGGEDPGGKEAPAASVRQPVTVSAHPAGFGVEKLELTPENEHFEPAVEAGAHPFQMTTRFDLNQKMETWDWEGKEKTNPAAIALPKTLSFDLPPGLIGNPLAMHQQECTGVDFAAQDLGNINSCPNDTVVGIATVALFDPIEPIGYTFKSLPVFNLVPAPGEPARFGFETFHALVVLDTGVLTGHGYGVQVTVHNASQSVQVLGSTVTIWGTPNDPRHDSVRGWTCLGFDSEASVVTKPCESQPPPYEAKPFLTLPTACGALKTSVEGEAWNGETLAASSESPPASALGGCGKLLFEPFPIEVQPDTENASTPSGLTVGVSLPDRETNGLAEATVKETTLALPPGLQASAGAANGLETCSVGQVGFSGLDSDTGETLSHELEEQHFSFLPSEEREQEVHCPSASKIGTVRIKTPLLEREVVGGAYLGSQDTDPFMSPLVLYIVAEEEGPNGVAAAGSRVLVKLAGEVNICQSVNPSTGCSEVGQLVSTFKNTPPTPFESLTLHLFNTERAAQATPAFCGSYPAVATFHTWSNLTKTSQAEFQITHGPNGGACTPKGGKLPFSPSLSAGSVNPQAAAFTPFTLTLGRADGDQALERVETELPPGLAALISQVTPCPEAEAEQQTDTGGPCPANSYVGHTTSVSGLGNSPVTLGGSLYFTGPLKQTATHGASPFGLLAVTHAKTGPFDLGYVRVFSTINVNENTAQAIVRSEPVPKMLDGVPVQLKELNVTVERPGGAPFQFNPTNCEELHITGQLTGYEGGAWPINEPFFAANCASLPFAPKLTASVKGQGSKEFGTTFTVTLESPGLGQANIHKVDLTIPASLPSRLTTIQKACLDSVFDVNPANCDEGSVIGEGIVHTPVFSNPLRGPAYLVSHGNAAFPDVEFVLQGEGVTLVLDGKTDIKNGITYSKFETSPDAPFTKFESIFPEGPHSALTPNVPEIEDYNLCKTSLSIPLEMTAQNGAFKSETVGVKVLGCGEVAKYKAKKLSKAEELKKALKACRTKYKAKSKKAKRLACEKAAQKKYGPAKKASKKAKKSSKKH